jgi:L-rhamnose isomerase/sugar isomerase
MIDQSHNVTDPIESLMSSATEILRCFVQASLVNRTELEQAQAASDALAGHRILKQAYITDVSPILAEARRRLGGALDPIATYRASGYRRHKAEERPAVQGSSSGIV